MSVALAGITFDHGRGLAGAYTLPLRWNAVEAVLLPEWAPGNRRAAPVAYVRDRLPASLVVLARFVSAETNPMEIRARSFTSGSPAAPPLPDLPQRLVNFGPGGDSGWCSFPFAAEALSSSVDVATGHWIWQRRAAPGAPWEDFDASAHTVYVVLSRPTAPWRLSPASSTNQTLPRVDALDVACRWARGAAEPAEAATRITRAVNDLGGRILSYDSVVGAPHYTVLGAPQFLLDAFLDRLAGGPGVGPLVNCSDCAAIVSTFANLLGTDLWQAKMGLVGEGFRLNPILAIGAPDWSTVWGAFTFHEVAWSGRCDEQETVFDACAQTDQDAHPEGAPHTPSLPANQPFGTPGSGEYRDQLAAAADRHLCAPQPSLRIRRPFSPQGVAFAPHVLAARRGALPGRLRELPARSDAGAGEMDHYEGFFYFGTELPGWMLGMQQQFTAATVPPVLLASAPLALQVDVRARVVVAAWTALDRRARRLRVESIETRSPEAARDQLLDVTAEIQCPRLGPWRDGPPRTPSLHTPDGTLVLFARGNLVHVLRSAGPEHVSVEAEARALDLWLRTAGTALDGGSAARSIGSAVGAFGWRRFHEDTGPAERSRADGSLASDIPRRRELVVTPAHAAAWRPGLRRPEA